MVHYFQCVCGRSGLKHKNEKMYNLYLVITDSGEEGMTFDLFIPFPYCHLVAKVELVTPRFHLNRTELSAREGDLLVGERETLPTGAKFMAYCNQHLVFLKEI